MTSYSREDFIANMIKELSSLTTTTDNDSSSFIFKDRNHRTDIEIYTKLCYDFPLITDNELNQLYQSLHEIFTTSTLTPTMLNLIDSFVISDVFLSNIKYLCTAFNTKISESSVLESTITSTTDVLEVTKGVQYKLAMLIYFQLPNYILNLNEMQVCKIFGIGIDHFDWYFVLQRYCDVVETSAVTALTGLASNDLQACDHCSSYLTSLTTCISTIGNFVDTFETNPHNDAIENDVVTVSLQKVDFPHASTLLTFLSELTKSSNKIAIMKVLKMLKKCWLHIVFLYRDLLTLFPVLFASHLTPFLNSIIPNYVDVSAKHPSHVHTSQCRVTSSVCLLVMTISNLANSMQCFKCPHDVIMVEDNAIIKQAERCLLAYLNNDNAIKLSLYVEICNQMAPDDVTIIPFETISLLLDVGILYISNNSSKYGSTVQQYLAMAVRTSGTLNQSIELLFTSRLLPSLFLNLLKILNKQKEHQTTVGFTRNMELQNHVFSRLLGFLSRAILSSRSVGDYMVSFPDLLQVLQSATNNIYQLMTSINKDNNLDCNIMLDISDYKFISPSLLAMIVSLELYSSVVISAYNTTTTSIKSSNSLVSVMDDDSNSSILTALIDMGDTIMKCIVAQFQNILITIHEFEIKIDNIQQNNSIVSVEELVKLDTESLNTIETIDHDKRFSYFYNSTQYLITELNKTLDVISTESAGALINSLFKVKSTNQIVHLLFDRLNNTVRSLLNVINEHIIKLQTISVSASKLHRIENFLQQIQKTKKYLKKIQDRLQGNISNKSD